MGSEKSFLLPVMPWLHLAVKACRAMSDLYVNLSLSTEGKAQVESPQPEQRDLSRANENYLSMMVRGLRGLYAWANNNFDVTPACSMPEQSAHL
ncbi:hypothetical protein BDW22DRAFT_1353014 [Trametopsis cervina]|nr:hypothetical protein BDW22DRAFT_1353014 [Trametopsis cervina]